MNDERRGGAHREICEVFVKIENVVIRKHARVSQSDGTAAPSWNENTLQILCPAWVV